MAQINFGDASLTCKLVYYGPGLSGKTTNLERIYDALPSNNRGELSSIATAGDRTIFFDFLPIDLGKVAGLNFRLQLFTVPGQSYYVATRRLVLTGADGVVFVADSQLERLQENVRCLEELGELLREHGRDLSRMPVVFQWNKRDLPQVLPVADLARVLNTINAPAFEAVAAQGMGVLPSLKQVASMVLDACRREYEELGAPRASSPAPTPSPAPSRTQTRRPVADPPPLGLEDSDEGSIPPPEPPTDPARAETRPLRRSGRHKRPEHPPAKPRKKKKKTSKRPATWTNDEAIGRTVGGCVLMTKLGEGGMGAVYLARHKATNATVVVKTLRHDRNATPKRVRRFFQEARAAARLEHENVVKVEEVGTDERGMHYMIMQHVGGLNLRSHVEERGRPLEPFEAARIVLEVARALEATHASGVIHRDIKPENVIIGEDGDIKLIDFGLARDLTAPQLTRTGEMVGTLVYMAPEILAKAPHDHRVDIFSLGLTWYYLVTARIPFLGEDPHDVIQGEARLIPPPVPGRIRKVMEGLLARRPDDRFADATALIEALESLWSPAPPGDLVADAGFWLWSGVDTHDDGSDVGAVSDLEFVSRADGVQDEAYRAEIRGALQAWDALDEAPAASEGIERMIEDAWSEDGAAWGDPVKNVLDTAPIDAAAPKKSKFLMTATWRLDLKDVLAEIDATPVEAHERKRLSRDPGQAEVNTLLRDGPAPSAGWGKKVRRTPSGELAELTEAIDANPEHPQPWTRRGIARARAKDLEGAIGDYTRALELDPRYLPALANRASARYHLKRYSEVVEDCTRALKRQPRLAKAWLFRGLAKAHLGSGTDAREDLFKFLRLAPYSPYVNYIRRVLSGGSSSD